MASSDLLIYLLYGIAGSGVLFGVLILALTFAQKGLENRQDDLDEAEEMPEQDEPAREETGGAVEVQNSRPVGARRVFIDEPDGVEVASPDEEADIAPTAAIEKPARDEGDAPASEAAQEELSDGIQRQETVEVQVGEYRLGVCSAMHIGARKEQQDAVSHGPSDEESVQKSGFLMVVCDGMGGMRMGAEAATLAARSFIDSYQQSELPKQRALREAVEKANSDIWQLCRADDLSGAGTTLIAALVTEEGFHYISVGDSHVYLYRKGVLSQLNVDHNYLNELLLRVRRGEITREQALSDPERAHLTSYLGVKRLTQVDRSSGPIEIEDGDRILLASDGLFKVLMPADIAGSLASYDGDSAARLIDEVIKRKYRNQDNVSVAVLALDKRQDAQQDIQQEG